MLKFHLKANEELVYIDYLMSVKEQEWKIFDVLLDGSISKIATKKSDFKKILEEKVIKGLISDLKSRNEP